MLTPDSLSVFVQGVAGFATAWIAWLTYQTNQKVRTLTDVVVELQQQNKLMSDRFQLEKKNSLRRRVPDFEIVNFYFTMNQNYVIELVNRGQYATHFLIVGERENSYKVKIGDYSEIAETKTLYLYVTFVPIEPDMKKINFDFGLGYKNGNGILMKQNISCVNGDILIVPQVEQN